ncbi:hypothetical protein PPL_05099 [Heterostelium album PN500]|uniref:Barstar (barnase inhibitor) domain-containing protein n=1 Tax=Heterostelium pallidum (strain ATCC 26659 / Pp 5 / PN500) TaxID=670386 RepID=D3B9F5_HETP5|nr:hypothetical protein PPL_05099 [Heterostelium album PN500]EFA81867.1 hypothetical protein PPL_05099 [Heterostelium album PN500]|eukprot:XP_020433984.1 hypothetical protein PPL_05099 [Heterostelium album PN500]
MTKIAKFDFRKIDNIDVFYDQLAEKTTVPSYFGRNLDALVDILRDCADAPLEIIFTHMNQDKQNQFGRLINVLKDVAEELDPGQLTFKIAS